MNHNNPINSAEESRKFPVKSLLIALAILAGAVAILVFKVPVGTVLLYGLIGFMLFSHLFMHSGHGAHAEHGQGASPSQHNGDHMHASANSAQPGEHNHAEMTAQPGNPETESEKDPNSKQGHSGCC